MCRLLTDLIARFCQRFAKKFLKYVTANAPSKALATGGASDRPDRFASQQACSSRRYSGSGNRGGFVPILADRGGIPIHSCPSTPLQGSTRRRSSSVRRSRPYGEAAPSYGASSWARRRAYTNRERHFSVYFEFLPVRAVAVLLHVAAVLVAVLLHVAAVLLVAAIVIANVARPVGVDFIPEVLVGVLVEVRRRQLSFEKPTNEPPRSSK